jgi:hypothetical protein
MAFERKQEKLLTVPQFLLRQGRYALFASGLIIFSLGIGMIGYHFLGHINWVDSFHMSSMILTGMGPVSEMKSDAAKIFSSIYALYSGVAFLSIAAVFFSPIIHRMLHILHIDNE